MQEKSMQRSNVEIQRDMEDFVLFNTTCECCLPQHAITVSVERWGDTDSMPMVSMYFTCACSDFGTEGSLLDKLRRRIQAAAKILWTGSVETQGSFIFRDREHVQDFVATLQEAVRQVEASASKAAS
ncbi:MAG: hypothetical protein IKT16_07265 [Desulfovibrio sp.]|nr:hypothetical protein [Desulfovibrio sp.]